MYCSEDRKVKEIPSVVGGGGEHLPLSLWDRLSYGTPFTGYILSGLQVSIHPGPFLQRPAWLGQECLHIWPRLFKTHSWNTPEALAIPEGPIAETRVCRRWRKETPLPSLPLRCHAFWTTSLPTLPRHGFSEQAQNSNTLFCGNPSVQFRCLYIFGMLI